jgi:hypothetical protein
VIIKSASRRHYEGGSHVKHLHVLMASPTAQRTSQPRAGRPELEGENASVLRLLFTVPEMASKSEEKTLGLDMFASSSMQGQC